MHLCVCACVCDTDNIRCMYNNHLVKLEQQSYLIELRNTLRYQSKNRSFKKSRIIARERSTIMQPIITYSDVCVCFCVFVCVFVDVCIYLFKCI